MFYEKLNAVENCDPKVPSSIELAYLCVARVRMRQWEERKGLSVMQHGPMTWTIDPEAVNQHERSLYEEVERLTPDESFNTVTDVPRFSIDEVPENPFEAPFPAVPFVIEGLASDTPACRKWSFDYFAKQYGDADLVYGALDMAYQQPDLMSGKLRDLIRRVEAGEIYIDNNAAVTTRYPEIVEELELERFEQRLGMFPALIHHFFMGNTVAGGWHAANGDNLFFNVVGQKTWLLTHPKYSAWMPGVLHFAGMNGFPRWELDGGFCDRSNGLDPGIKERWPLFYRIPKFRAVLNPGDVLYNPPWWWHSVHNTAGPTIAFATRHQGKSWRRFLEYLTLNNDGMRAVGGLDGDEGSLKVFSDWTGALDFNGRPSTEPFNPGS